MLFLSLIWILVTALFIFVGILFDYLIERSYKRMGCDRCGKVVRLCFCHGKTYDHCQDDNAIGAHDPDPLD